uniref:Uncharacterized protein n=1 Tax=Rhizophora mucronata TaxID=61149 RepID=A0A2P2P2Z3_RHIMU
MHYKCTIHQADGWKTMFMKVTFQLKVANKFTSKF